METSDSEGGRGGKVIGEQKDNKSEWDICSARRRYTTSRRSRTGRGIVTYAVVLGGGVGQHISVQHA